MSWRGEKHRHSLAAKGIKSKYELINTASIPNLIIDRKTIEAKSPHDLRRQIIEWKRELGVHRNTWVTVTSDDWPGFPMTARKAVVLLKEIGTYPDHVMNNIYIWEDEIRELKLKYSHLIPKHLDIDDPRIIAIMESV